MAQKGRVFKRGAELQLEITDLAFGGKGIAKVPIEDGLFTVFVQNTIPGQKVRARVTESKKRYAECSLLEVLEHSDLEVDIPYQPIPGAPYASLPIATQHAFKKKNALDLFERIGKIPSPESLMDEFIPSPLTWYYRNKMEYSFCHIVYDLNDNLTKDIFGFGFKHRGMWWAVENLDKDSGLFDKEIEDRLISIRHYCENTGLRAWHPPKQYGFFRYMVVRKSQHDNKFLFGFVTSSDGLDEFNMDAFRDLLLDYFGDRVAGILHVTYDETGDHVKVLEGNTRLLYGESKIKENLLGLEFEVSLQSFFQPNPKAAEKLYQKTIDYTNEHTPENAVVLDLFCGTGTITQLLARHNSRKVIGVDIVAEAIEDARINAQRNGIENVTFYSADAGKFLEQYPEYQGQLHTVVMDPPRAGLAPKTLDLVIGLGAKCIVYVSCNPATQARDAEILRNSGYDLVKFSLVDQFPHTSHLECVMLFEKQ
jgi:23S rRNA (uracil-5-)-methyltransferase RumA